MFHGKTSQMRRRTNEPSIARHFWPPLGARPLGLCRWWNGDLSFMGKSFPAQRMGAATRSTFLEIGMIPENPGFCLRLGEHRIDDRLPGKRFCRRPNPVDDSK